jgi:hypothetical protein
LATTFGLVEVFLASGFGASFLPPPDSIKAPTLPPTTIKTAATAAMIGQRGRNVFVALCFAVLGCRTGSSSDTS